MADEREQQIRERLEAATPGPWRTWREGDPETWFLAGSVDGTEYELGTIGGYYQESASPETGLAVPADNSPDAELISNAPADLAYLLDALAAARKENGRLREALEPFAYCERIETFATPSCSAGRFEPCGVCGGCKARAALAREDGDGR